MWTAQVRVLTLDLAEGQNEKKYMARSSVSIDVGIAGI
jgi:hypothetical protein